MALVFQYGSNCLDSQINSTDRLCGDAKFIGIAETVMNFIVLGHKWGHRRICFLNSRSPKDGVPKEGGGERRSAAERHSRIAGTLWQLDPGDCLP